MPPNTLRVHTEYVLVKISGSVVLWAESRAQELENISLPFSLNAEIVEVEIEVVSPSIVLSGSFTELKSHCHLYGAQGQRQAYLLPLPR
ncbi:hypothetical protein TNCV_2551561 [Trichonephila clavipes]|nr:hypothetical protein TNCV_2551561 [Trichonephila clavipes]